MHAHHIQIGSNIGSIGKLVKNKKVYQRGYNNLSHRNYYIRRSQRGHGFGAVFSGLSRFLIPLIRSGYNALKNEAISAGGDILNDLNIENIIKKRGKQAVQNLKTKAVDKIDSIMTGSGSKKRRKTIKRMYTKKNVQILPELNRTHKGKFKTKLNINIKQNGKGITKKASIKDIFG